MVVNVGSVEVVASLNTSSIQRGIEQLKGGMDAAKNTAKSAFGDIERLGGSMLSLAAPIAGIGIALAGATVGIAALGPAAAPALARMKVSFDLLTRSLSRELKPVFDMVAKGFADFVQWITTDGKPIISALNDTFLLVGSAIGSAWESAKDLWSLFTKNEGVFDSLGEEISNVWVKMEDNGAIDSFKEAFDNAGVLGDKMLKGLGEWVDDLWSKMKQTGAIDSLETGLADLGSAWGDISVGVIAGLDEFYTLLGDIGFFDDVEFAITELTRVAGKLFSGSAAAAREFWSILEDVGAIDAATTAIKALGVAYDWVTDSIGAAYTALLRFLDPAEAARIEASYAAIDNYSTFADSTSDLQQETVPTYGGITAHVGDFVSRPNQELIAFSPNDTIIGIDETQKQKQSYNELQQPMEQRPPVSLYKSEDAYEREMYDWNNYRNRHLGRN